MNHLLEMGGVCLACLRWVGAVFIVCTLFARRGCCADVDESNWFVTFRPRAAHSSERLTLNIETNKCRVHFISQQEKLFLLLHLNMWKIWDNAWICDLRYIETKRLGA